MKQKVKTRQILSFLLSLALVLGLVSGISNKTVKAADETYTFGTEGSDTLDLSGKSAGYSVEIYDSGGPDAAPGNNENFTLTIETDKAIQISGSYDLDTNPDNALLTVNGNDYTGSGTIEDDPVEGDSVLEYTSLTTESGTGFVLTATVVGYKVTYDANGATNGTAPTDNNVYYDGDNVTTAGNSGNRRLRRTNYSFGGWNTAADGSGTTYETGAQFAITEDTTLYAYWIPDAATAATISSQPRNNTVTYAYTGTALSVTARVLSLTAHTLSYQWYETFPDDPETEDVAIEGATDRIFRVPDTFNAGTVHSCYCIVTSTRNNNGAKAYTTSNTATVTITKGDPIIDPEPIAKDLVYNGEEQELASPGDTDGGTIVYALGENDHDVPGEEPEEDDEEELYGDDGDEDPEDDPFTEEIPTGIDADTYYVWYKVIGDDNHNNTDPECIEVTIAPLVAELEWSDTILEYNGKEQAPTVEISNLVEGDDVTVLLEGQETNVGIYTAQVYMFEGDDANNYLIPEDDTHLYNIVKAKADLSVSIDDWTYGEAAKRPSVEGVPEGFEVIVEYKVYGAKNSTYTTKVPTEANIYNIRASIQGNKNVEAVSVEDSFTINPKVAELVWGETTFIYNGKDQIPSVKVGNLEKGDTCKLIVTGAATEVGKHKAVVIKITNKNYTLPDEIEKEFTIKKEAKPATTDIYRVYNPNSGEHVYTKSASEKAALVKAGWKDEGLAWKSPAKSNTPVYRVYNPNAGDHHYTISASEKAELVKAGWKDEGIVWYSDDAKTTPVYRVYNPNAKAGAHHFTKSKDEVKQLVKAGWKDEGIAFYSK